MEPTMAVDLSVNDDVAEMVTAIEEFVDAIIANKNSPHVEDAMDVARKRAALTVIMIQIQRKLERKFQPRYDYR